MKKLIVIGAFLIFVGIMFACQQQNQPAAQDLASPQESNAYVPGIGDLMGKLQLHHNKLWFAGINENWPLAEFALHELEESVEDLQNFHADREELQTLAMILPPLELMHETIENQNLEEFKSGYITLTNTCNSCHDVSGFDFIEITTPTSPVMTNQVYSRNL